MTFTHKDWLTLTASAYARIDSRRLIFGGRGGGQESGELPKTDDDLKMASELVSAQQSLLVLLVQTVTLFILSVVFYRQAPSCTTTCPSGSLRTSHTDERVCHCLLLLSCCSPSNVLAYQLLRHPLAIKRLLTPDALLLSVYQSIQQTIMSIPVSAVFQTLYLGKYGRWQALSHFGVGGVGASLPSVSRYDNMGSAVANQDNRSKVALLASLLRHKGLYSYEYLLACSASPQRPAQPLVVPAIRCVSQLLRSAVAG